MMTTEQIAAGINERHPGRNWHMWCQALVYWTGVVVAGGANRRTYERAIWAYNDSHIESHDPLAAPAGAIHYFLNPAGHGHVGVEMGGGTALMTGTEHELGAARRMLGTNYGTTTIASFMARRTQVYLGWSTTNGRNETLIGKIGTPTPPQKKDEDMPRVMNMRSTVDGKNIDGKMYFDGGPGVGVKHILNPDHLKLLRRYVADKPGDFMYPTELALVNSYLAPNSPIISAETVESAVKEAIGKMGVTVEAAAVAAAVEQTLKDDFAAIPASVATTLSDKLK